MDAFIAHARMKDHYDLLWIVGGSVF